MTDRDTFTSSQPGWLLVPFLALISLAETSGTVLKRNGCLHFICFYSTPIPPKKQEEQNPYKILEQNPACFFFLSWWFFPTFLFSSSFFFFFWARRGGGADRPGNTWPAWPSLCSSVFMMFLWIPSWNVSLVMASLIAASRQQREKISCTVAPLGGAARVSSTHNDGSGGNQSPRQCVNKGHVKSQKGQCVGW